MQTYLDLLSDILEHGEVRQDRTGVGTRSVFGRQMRFDLAAGFPLLTTKYMPIAAIIHELVWFLRGSTNTQYLTSHGVHIWDAWANKAGDLGPVYGKQWRAWTCPDGRVIDQIAWVINEIKRDPFSRRLIVSAWNVADLYAMALMPCHVLFQFYVHDGRLSCQLFQRSGDIFLGVPFNIASYSLLTMMVAQVTGLQPGTFVHTLGDAHLYLNHEAQAREQLVRTPMALPTMQLDPAVTCIDCFRREHFKLLDYTYHPAIPAPIAV